jgi:hypothetical protein
MKTPLFRSTAVRAVVLSAGVIAAPLACGSTDPAAGRPSLETSPEGPSLPVDHPPVDPSKVPVTAAVPQRLSVQQLRQTFPVTMGSDQSGKAITWIDGKKPGLDSNADTLGEADYIVLTEEMKEPSPLYLKFVDDAARSTCDQALATDWAIADPSGGTVLRHAGTADSSTSNAAGVDANLRYLKLRMHGVKVADDDTTSIQPLRALFDDTVAAWAAGGTATDAHVKEGWRVVCVALLTAPEFHLY